MKTTSNVYNQYLRISRTLSEVKQREIKKADPATGGNEMLCNNWGNDQARKVMHSYWDRSFKLHEIYQKAYKKAFANEFPDHNESKRYFATLNH